MLRKPKPNLHDRVENAANRILEADGAVGILEILQSIGFLERVHFEAWKKGMQHAPILDKLIQCGDAKRKQTIEHFLNWVKAKGLEPFEASFQTGSRNGGRSLQLTESGDAEIERLYATKFRSPHLTAAKKERLEKKANKVADLMVYIHTGDDSQCAECQRSLVGEMLYLENEQALCLDCADMAHLSFLPSGNATITRRAKKNSPLSAVVLKFNRRRKRYDRQGLLVTQEAIEQAEDSCVADADQRAIQRAKAAERRDKMDEKLVNEMTELILSDFPACPAAEARQIAMHTAERGSGRVGRSAAGRSLSADAIRLAVRAWIRHQHTNYDSLLMKGVERMESRRMIDATLNEKLAEWQRGG